jgi:hypothetical protein
LAQHYSVDPAIFLDKPLTELLRDMHWTDLLLQKQRPPEDV